MWTYTHDAEGNVTKKSKGASAETWVYAYDHRNQMLTATQSATDGGAATQRVTYGYDAIGNRIERQAWDGTTSTTARYGLDGYDPAKPSPIGRENFDPYIDLDGSNNVTMRRAWGVEFDEVVARQTAGGTVSWYQADHQGSVRQVIDNSASVLATSTFSAYGELTGGSLSDRLGYTGQEYDDLTKNTSMGGGTVEVKDGLRYQEDPKHPETGPNPWVYASNNPTNRTDPSGMDDDFARGLLQGFSQNFLHPEDAQRLDRFLQNPGQGGLYDRAEQAFDRLKKQIMDFIGPLDQPPDQGDSGPSFTNTLWNAVNSPGFQDVIRQAAEAARNAPRPTPVENPWFIDFIGGAVGEAVNMVTGLFHAVTHPVETAEAIAALADPDVWDAVVVASLAELDRAAGGCGESAGKIFVVGVTTLPVLQILRAERVLAIAKWVKGKGPRPRELPLDYKPPSKVDMRPHHERVNNPDAGGTPQKPEINGNSGKPGGGEPHTEPTKPGGTEGEGPKPPAEPDSPAQGTKPSDAPATPPFSVPPGLAEKIPPTWTAQTNKKKPGMRWEDPKNPKGNGVRVDKGDPNSTFPSQQVDHVVVRKDGKIIGKDGKPISGSIAENAVDAHIPLSEYLTWKTWDAP